MNFISFSQRIKMLFFLTVNIVSAKVADFLSNLFFAAKKKPAKKGGKKPAKKKSNDDSDDNMGNDDQGSFNSGQF